MIHRQAQADISDPERLGSAIDFPHQAYLPYKSFSMPPVVAWLTQNALYQHSEHDALGSASETEVSFSQLRTQLTTSRRAFCKVSTSCRWADMLGGCKGGGDVCNQRPLGPASCSPYHQVSVSRLVLAALQTWTTELCRRYCSDQAECAFAVVRATRRRPRVKPFCRGSG